MEEKSLTMIEDFHRYVTFEVGNELFGIRIESVEQIIIRPPITSVPKTPDFFIGLLNLRGDTISTIDLRKRFGLPALPPTLEQRVIIIEHQNSRLGFLVDKIGAVVNIPIQHIFPASPLIDPQTLDYLLGSAQLAEDQVLLLLDDQQLMNQDEFHLDELTIRSDNPAQQSSDLMIPDPESVLIAFEINHEFYAMNIKEVEEIIRMPTLTKIHQASHLIEGIFHLRNEAIPLLKLSGRLQIGHSACSENTPVLIVHVERIKMGIAIDQVNGILRIQESEIEKLPQNIIEERAKHLKGIVQDQRGKGNVYMILLLDRLFSENELDRLGAFQNEIQDQLEQQESTEDHQEILSLLYFKIGTEIYAIRILQVHQITQVFNILPVPRAPKHIEGIMNVRGETITIFHLPKMFDSDQTLQKHLARIIVVELQNSKIGLLVEEILGIAYISNTKFDPPGEWTGKGRSSLVEALGKDDGKVVVLIDLDAIVSQVTDQTMDALSA